MSKNETINSVLNMLAMYNRKMYEYGKKYRHYGTEHSLCQEQIYLISQIGKNPGCSLRALAEATASNVATVSLRVNRLADMGLIDKRRNENNLREIEITLTQDGRKAYDYHKNLDTSYFSQAAVGLSSYSEEELETVLRFFRSLYEHDLRE